MQVKGRTSVRHANCEHTYDHALIAVITSDHEIGRLLAGWKGVYSVGANSATGLEGLTAINITTNMKSAT